MLHSNALWASQNENDTRNEFNFVGVLVHLWFWFLQGLTPNPYTIICLDKFQICVRVEVGIEHQSVLQSKKWMQSMTKASEASWWRSIDDQK
jgi:hypothetical protein